MTLCVFRWFSIFIDFESSKHRVRGARRQRRQPVNVPRQGPALLLTACQTSPNVVPTLCLAPAGKKNAELNALAYFLFVTGSDLHTLTLCLKGWGRPWETLPLKKSPFLTALVCAMMPKRRFPSRLTLLFLECVVLSAWQRISPCAADPPF